MTEPLRSLTRELLGELWKWEVCDFTDADLLAVRNLFLDHVAAAAWGSTIEAGHIMREHAAHDVGGAGPSLPVIGTSLDLPAVPAAMANAVAAACFEFDDTHTAGSLHPGAVIFPAAMAAATLGHCDRGTFVRAVVIGYEVMCRVGRAVNPHAHRARHFHPTSTTGHFGAAAAASICLGLDVDTAVAALSLAGTAAGGNMQFVLEGGWTKQVHPAFAVQRGIAGAQLAARGFPGVHDPIGGPRAFLASQSEAPHPDVLLEGLGTRPREIRRTGIKPYPSCRNTQSPLDALLHLRRQHGFTAEDVKSVEFGLIDPALPTIFLPPERRRRPRTLADAQFSMPFVAAVALTDGRVGLDQFRPERILDPALHPLMDAVECVHDPALDARYPVHWPSWARVTTTDGTSVEATVEHPRGDPENPLTDEELMSKLTDLTVHCFAPAQRELLWAEASALSSDEPWSTLVELLGGGV